MLSGGEGHRLTSFFANKKGEIGFSPTSPFDISKVSDLAGPILIFLNIILPLRWSY